MPRIRSPRAWLWVATLPPAALIAVLVVRNAVDVLFMDDWSIVGHTLIRVGSGELGVRDLIAHHNESLPFFPKLLFLGIGLLTHGDFRWLLLVTFSLACVVSYAVLFLRAYANGLDQLGYLHPGLIRSRRLEDIRAEGPAVREAGVFERLFTRPGGGRFVAEGWAGLPTGSAPADAVILARQESEGEWAPLEFAPVLEPRPDIARVHGRAYQNSGWLKGLVKRDLPPRPFRIGAWAFDAERGWAVPLAGTYTVEAGARSQR